ncbi:MAG: hypothetical protein LBB22_06050 [Treponema sp.]|jgi:hypothetical protein|nr:hypothetical protein [Treponema sp.]
MIAYIFSSIALLISVISFFIIFFYVKKRTDTDRIPAETRLEVAKIINEIDRITDRDSELIEERVSKLKSFLEDMDRRIALHEGQIKNYKTAEEITKKLNDEKKDASVEAYRELGKNAFAHKNYSSGMPPPLRISIVENNSTGDGGQAPEEQSHVRKAAELAAAGVPVSEIAKRLNATINEIEIALFLSSRRTDNKPL